MAIPKRCCSASFRAWAACARVVVCIRSLSLFPWCNVHDRVCSGGVGREGYFWNVLQRMWFAVRFRTPLLQSVVAMQCRTPLSHRFRKMTCVHEGNGFSSRKGKKWVECESWLRENLYFSLAESTAVCLLSGHRCVRGRDGIGRMRSVPGFFPGAGASYEVRDG